MTEPSFFALWNFQPRPVFALVAIYMDRHYFIKKIEPQHCMQLATGLLESSRILLADSAKEARRLIAGLPSDFVEVKYRIS